MTKCTFIAVALLAFALATEPMALAQPNKDAQVAQVLADWKARRERFASVRYTVSGILTRYRERENDLPPALRDSVRPDPPGGKEKRLKAKILIDLLTNKYRIEETEPVPSLNRDRWVPLVRVTAYNGTIHQQAFPREENRESRSASDADLSIAKGNLSRTEAADVGLWPLFSAHGIVPTADLPLRVDRFPSAHEPDDFLPRGTAVHAGRPCLVFSTSPTGTSPNLFDEFHIDRQRQSAVVRHVYHQGKNPLYRFDVTHSEVQRAWLPKQWSLTTTLGGQVDTVTKYVIDAIELNPTLREEDFTIPITPGMIVTSFEYPAAGTGLDVERPAKGNYLAVEGGRLEEIEPPTGFTTTGGTQLPPEARHRRWLWWGGGAIGIALIVGYGIRRRVAAARQANTGSVTQTGG